MGSKDSKPVDEDEDNEERVISRRSTDGNGGTHDIISVELLEHEAEQQATHLRSLLARLARHPSARDDDASFLKFHARTGQASRTRAPSSDPSIAAALGRSGSGSGSGRNLLAHALGEEICVAEDAASAIPEETSTTQAKTVRRRLHIRLSRALSVKGPGDKIPLKKKKERRATALDLKLQARLAEVNAAEKARKREKVLRRKAKKESKEKKGKKEKRGT